MMNRQNELNNLKLILWSISIKAFYFTKINNEFIDDFFILLCLEKKLMI